MWNKSRSILLSKACVIIFSLIGVTICISLPWLANVLIKYSGANLTGKYVLILISGYSLAVPAFAVLYYLYKLLRNISDEYVFINENTVYLKRISWLCILAGGICFLSALYYPAMLVISMMAAFIGLIIRILKNVFNEAVLIKEENDFTI